MQHPVGPRAAHDPFHCWSPAATAPRLVGVMPRPCTLRRVLATRSAMLAPVAALALAALPAPALASNGGAASPDFPAPGPEHSGGALAVPRLRTMLFAVSTSSVQVGRSLRFAWRVDGPVRSVTARVELVPEGGGAPVRVALGTRRTGTRSSRRWTARQGRVAAGR